MKFIMNETLRNKGKIILIISAVTYCFSFGPVRMEHNFSIWKKFDVRYFNNNVGKERFFEWIVLWNNLLRAVKQVPEEMMSIVGPYSYYLELLVRDSKKFEIEILVENSHFYLGEKSSFILFGCLIYTLFFWEDIFTKWFVIWKTRYLFWCSMKTGQFFIALFIVITQKKMKHISFYELESLKMFEITT